MNVQAKKPIEHKMSLTNYKFLDSNLDNYLDHDCFLTQQYIEATQIITDLHDQIVDINKLSGNSAYISHRSTIESHSSDDEVYQGWQSVSASIVDEKSAADFRNLISELTNQLTAQLDAYTVNQNIITGSTNRLSMAIDIMSEGVDEIDQLLMPVRFDDRDN